MSESVLDSDSFITTSTRIGSAVPKCVQVVILGEPNDEQPRCTGCRTNDKVFRCARCQVAHYCSQQCQKKHFGFHKKLCKQVSSLRNNVEQFLHQDEHDKTNSNHNPSMECLSDLITTLIIMGYRETDTVANGKCYYRKALQYAVELARICRDDTSHDDLVLLLLGILGASPATIGAWCTSTPSQRNKYFTVTTTEQVDFDAVSNVFTTPRGLTSNDFTFQMVGLLVLMRLLATHQQQPSAKEGPSPTDGIKQQITLLLDSLKSHNHIQALIHLRDTSPFSPHDAPQLGTPDKVPEEIWYLYQDCFFTTPGVNNILHDFLPEDDDPIDSSSDE